MGPRSSRSARRLLASGGLFAGALAVPCLVTAYLGIAVLEAGFVIEPTSAALFEQAAKAPYARALLLACTIVLVLAAVAVVRTRHRTDRDTRVRTCALAFGGALLSLLVAGGAHALVQQRLAPQPRLAAELDRLPAPADAERRMDGRPAPGFFYDQPSVLYGWEVRGRSAEQVCADESAVLARLGAVRPAGLRPIPGLPGPACVLSVQPGRDRLVVAVRTGRPAGPVTDATELTSSAGFTGADVVTLVRQATAERP